MNLKIWSMTNFVLFFRLRSINDKFEFSKKKFKNEHQNFKSFCNCHYNAFWVTIKLQIIKNIKLIKRFSTLQKRIISIHCRNNYCTLKFCLHQFQWNEKFRFRRIQIVHHHTHQHISQCVIDDFSILLHSCVKLLFDYNWDQKWSN